ncbi:hypothetical protein F4778DRAFT_780143 [Xylariomycetidae sp. FL2044]|nr:hypothetical protein F4778DRAFT_780143 [Xylariomycetidae sp. FL2044]
MADLKAVIPLEFDDLNPPTTSGSYNNTVAYAQSKLAQIYVANSIERHYGPKGLHGLSAIPGGIITGLQTGMSEEDKRVWTSNAELMKGLKSAEQGAATTFLAAVGREWEGVGCKYLEMRVGADVCKSQITKQTKFID